MIVASTLGRLGVQATGPRLREEMAHIRDYAGIDGKYDFEKTPQRGLDVTNTLVARWEPSLKQWRAVSMPGGEPVQER